MSSLNPNTNFEVAVERPVDQPSFLGAVAGLAEAGVKAYAQTGSIDPSEDSGLRSAVIRGMKRIRAAKRQGKHDLARRLEMNLITEYSKAGGDPSDEWFNQMATSITGREADVFSLSDEEVAMQDLLESEDYRDAYAATLVNHPDVSPEERQQIALSNVAVRQGRRAVIDQANYTFTTETAGAITQELDDWMSSVFGVVAAAAQSGQQVTLEDADALALRWSQETARMTRPPNVSDEAWAPVQERIDSYTNLINTFRDIVEPGNVEAQALSNLYTSVKAAGFPNEDLLLTALSADPAMLLDFGILDVSEVTSALKSLDNSDGTALGPDGVRNPAALDGNIPQPGQPDSRTPAEIFTVARDSIRVANQHGQNLANNPDLRENWASIVVRGVDHIEYLAGQGQYLSEGSMNSIFNEKYFKNLNTVMAQDPELGQAILERTQRALTRAGQTMERQYRNVRQGSPWDYDIRTNTFNINRGSIRRAMGNDEQADKFLAAVDRVYGGDVQAMVDDNGQRFRDTGGTEWWRVWDRLTDGTGAPPEDLTIIANSMHAVANAQTRLTGNVTSDLDPANVIGTEGSLDIPSEVMQDQDFLVAVTNTSAALNLNPNDLMQAIAFETAGTFSPSIRNPQPGQTATGLIQFLESTANDLGTTTAELAGMTRAEQMAYVERYLAPKLQGVSNPDFGHIYMAIHYPVAVNKPDSFVIYSSSGDRRSRNQYRNNAGLDLNGDGDVTRGEAVAAARQKVSGVSVPAMPDILNGSESAGEGAGAGGGTVGITSSPRPRARPTGGAESVTDPSAGSVEVDRTASQLSARTLEMLAAVGLREDEVVKASNDAEVEEAIEQGRLKMGDFFLLNGQLLKYNG